ncbi:DUF1667 domain-containing protein [Candidatus Stoquefichus massiliensis]|uniref:DUF1667 domain-containing protein n=1 Tax=Candidatus Stoquefichus massiliensis TaxID=1470350 RepID=UPI0004B9D68F|nr:DUF1667 domain-containing protein [Candidatus Stoquefichus massiliensis]
MLKEMICITCPIGCHLTIRQDGDDIEVTGNTCPRGKQYAIAELTNPTRMLTTTVVIKNALYHQLPVISSAPIPLDKIEETMKLLKEVAVTAPIYEKDIIMKDIFGLGIDIIASRSMKKVD